MKILRLDLTAFGPFTGGRLDFARKPDALQLIYGPNEAGKSTTLRALLALLYGIPVRTSDAHLHEMTRLRIGGMLEDHRGRVLSITRRKGAKHTLLDDKGEPTSESALSELLLGIDESMFRHMFGLDHERLRAGGEALLAGAGNLGEGLFDASVGTRALRELKEALRNEAEALYKARGKTPKLNLALEALREKARQKKEAALSPQAFADQTKALNAAKQRREQCLAERRALLVERAGLEQGLRLLPVLARHAQRSAELKQLLESQRARGAGQASSAGGHLSPLASPRARFDLAEEQLRELERRYGAALSYEAELPRIDAELSALARELGALRARLGAAAGVEHTVDTPLRTRWRKLADAQTGTLSRIAELRQSRLAIEAELAQLDVRLSEFAESGPGPALAALRERVEREDLLAARARADTELKRRAVAVQRGLVQLGVSWARQAEPLACCERLAGMRVPLEPELHELELREQALERTAARSAERRRELGPREAALLSQRAELLAQGELSTQGELVQARTAREAMLASALPEAQRLVTYQREVLRTDALADKLLSEAVRSAEVGRVARELSQLQAELGGLGAAEAEVQVQAAQLAQALDQLLFELGLGREGLRLLRPKLAKLAGLRESAGEALAQELVCSQLAQREAELSQALAAQLGLEIEARGSAGAQNSASAAGGLTALLAEAEARLRGAELRERELTGLRDKRLALAARLAGAEKQGAELESEAAARLGQLERELSARGFPPELSHDEVLACLDDLALLGAAQLRQGALLERKASAEVARVQLERDVAAELLLRVPGAVASGLAEQLAVLSQAERSARESQRDGARLRQELEGTERELSELGDGADLDSLRQRARGLEPNAMRARLVETETQLTGLEDELGGLDQNIGGLEVGLCTVTEAPHAVPVAEEFEAELANVRALTRRYLELRLSQSLLAREVERHRREHQGPLVTRASALFSNLTLGRYTGLSVELDERDEPLLCALSSLGKMVRVAGLSDGTRDQLYLALRIASIERFLAASPALPLVLDDAFIHFDDARAEVALLALSELGKKTQVLFFTHHARMVELAKRALKPSQIALHELDPARGTVAFRDNGPLFAGA